MAISIRQLIPNFHPESEQATDLNFRHQGKILGLFKILRQENTILKISLPEANKEYSSSVVDIDEKNLSFTLNELFPEDGHTLFSRHGKLIAHAQVHGAKISFDTSLIQADHSGQFIHYLCDIPDAISYVQRRAEFRVQIPAPHLIQITAQHLPSKQLLTGNVHDISLQGIGVVLNTHHLVKPGDQLIHCKLQLTNSETVNFSLNARHIVSKSPNRLHVGGNFKELDPRSSKIIARFVRELERMAIRN